MNNKTLLCFGVCVLAAAGCKFLAQQLVDYTESWSSGMPKSRGALAGGLQSGEWTYFHENGKPRAKGGYANDRQVGPWTFYFESGVVERQGSYDDKGLRTGPWKEQYPDQTPRSRGSYVADFEDGPWEFFGADGSRERVGQFDAGQLSGMWTFFYPGGRPRASGMYFRGERIGPWRLFDEQGQERAQDFGSPPGVQVVREMWPNGKDKRAGVLQNGQQVGRWTSWHDNGNLRFCCTLTGKVPSGVFEARDAGGNIVAQGRFADGTFAPGGTAVVGGVTRELATAPLAAPAGVEPWSGASLDTLAPEALVALHVVEAGSGVPPAAVLAKAPETTTPPPPAPEAAAVVAKIDAEPARAPAPMQPDLSVKQRQEMKSYVREYAEGTAPGAGGSLLDKYKVSPNAPKPSGTGELKDWYGKPLPFQTMKGVDGKDVDLTQYVGKKKVMIVVLRGFLGEVCCYCVAQTKALSQSKARLDELGIEVLVVYPGAKENEQSFEQAYRMTFQEGGPPYRVFYDQDLSLVKQLGIDGDLASPSTLIVDEQGKIQFFYKGEHRADRPAAKKLLQIIEGMKK